MRETPLAPQRPVRRDESLIQRAAEVYDFKRYPKDNSPIAGAFAVPGTATPAPAFAPAPAMPVAPVVAPAQPARPAEGIDLAALREGGFIVPGAPPNRVSEEFRIVKRQLLMSAFGGSAQAAVPDGRCILVCSAQPNEGKTFSAVNLALSLASEPDIEVLLVDADVAKPEVLSTLGIAGGAGLMDAIEDTSLNVADLIVQTDVARLSVLPAGRQTPNDTELLASMRGRAIVEGLYRPHPNRVVVIDTAPALAASPASALIHLVGQILMVVRADRTTENELREAVGMLSCGAQLRLLLNGTTYQGTTRNYGSYYGYGEV